ncbi:MAG TPA: TadE/TadG family type IV pilus assembly protein [Xanthobacteraceae bacterium]|nr:TadE/TadG family type IV pilus assembly protein [Xanthobacteraceae bacterium]
MFSSLRASRLTRFARDRRGVSAVEFALIAPLLVAIYFGGIEVTTAVAVDRKMTLVAHTVADLAAQSSKLTEAEITDILKASVAISAPYATSNLKVTVSSIEIDANGQAKIKWSRSYNGTAHSPDSVPLPAALKVPNTSLIWGEASYDYKPMFGTTVFKASLTLGDANYMRPRISSIVECCNG